MKLSVITINYNNCDGLRKTIESVVNQTYNDFEYIIIDGGSTDGSVDVIKEYADRIDYWVSESDKGIYNAMNKGIDVAKGEYCIFINSGDFFFSNCVLEECIPYLDGTDVISGRIQTDKDIWESAKVITLSFFYRKKGLLHPASFIKTQLLKKYHYDENLSITSDWKFCIQTLIFGNSSYKGVDVIVSAYDTSGLSYSSRDRLLAERSEVLESLFPKRVLDDMRSLVFGDTFEDKLYIRIKSSKYNKFFIV